ncbi:MAG: heme exporter protein CcmB [Dehalococcoidia bacterium]
MKSYLSSIVAIVWKDLILEARTKEVFLSIFIFSLLTVVTFNFAFDPTPNLVVMVAPGILWVAIAFGGMLGLSRMFSIEMSSGGLDGILLTPVSRDAVFYGKFLTCFIFMALVEIILLPVMVVFFDLNFNLVPLIIVSVLVLSGFSLVGTLFAAISINTKAREIMLPVLYLPVIAPLLISAVECTSTVFLGDSIYGSSQWLGLLVLFDAVYAVATPFCFTLLVAE